jgi:hypothetical protein
MTRSAALALALLALPAADAAAADRLVHRTPRGAEFTVTADGLASIRVGGRALASGGWSVFNAEGWFKDCGTRTVKAKTVGEKTIEVLGPDRARVRHVKDDLLCLAEYAFAGEDVTIRARVENRHADASLQAVGFSGLTFTFDRPPEGLMYVQHITYFQAHGVGLCHPGHWARIGGSWAADGSAGVGTSPWATGLMRTLTLWDYADWNPQKREKHPVRRLLYFAVAEVPPQGARTFAFRLRVGPTRDWKHLLAPYREHFRKTFGEVRYRADDRWIATDYLNHSQRAIGPDNPYGFHGGHRRIDTPDGAKRFCDTLIPGLKEANGQGVIVWGQGGDDPRGCMYRPDFDVLPPEVEANWPAIAKAFRDAGLKLGVTTRPRDLCVRKDWKRDLTIDINPDDPGHRGMIWNRFKTMIDKGCTLFYLDSFGSSFEDVKLMRFLREQLGPDVLTYCEHQCDAIFPYSGGYSECTLDAEDPKAEPAYHIWSGLSNWEVYRWLTPGAQLASRLYQIKGKPGPKTEPADRFFMKNRVMPLVPVNDTKARLPDLKKYGGESLDGKGRWKE